VRIALVIPAFNEAGTIGRVVRESSRYGDPVVVDDGSHDSTASEARHAGAAAVVRHGANRGYDQALRSGFAYAAENGYEVIASLDADNQHEPSLLAAMLQPILDGSAEMVLGVRPRSARLAEMVFAAYTRRGYRLADPLCGMKAFAVPVYRRHAWAMCGDTIGTGLALAALRAGTSHAVVSVPVRERAGASRFGSGLRPNLRVFRALVRQVARDLRPSLGRRIEF
jgi:glycosyltransferase involved in cell wall biosynthesis